MHPSHVEALPKAALLCIDDNQDVLECEKDFLETFGYTVVTASSGAKVTVCHLLRSCHGSALSRRRQPVSLL
jgi:CheY-like chemotaxis protein